MDSELEVGVEGRTGVIALNRPTAINALSRDMVLGIGNQLAAWRSDEAVRAVLFEGRGPKGFCSGGDVRFVRNAVLSGQPAAGLDFFADEYLMNAAISKYEKPVVVIADGIVMGGGIGIAGHADFRFAASNARFAMPESAIGFVCDIGVNAILARAPLHRALLFLLTGLPVGVADALALGLTDCVVPLEQLPGVRQSVLAAAQAPDVPRALVALMQDQGIEPGEAPLCAIADSLEAELSLPTAAEIVAAIADASATVAEFPSVAQTLRSRSPTSLETILQMHLAARRLADIDLILAMDLRLARWMAQRPDFAEGVRAVLVDKDQKPRWDPAGFGGVDRAAIAAEIAASQG